MSQIPKLDSLELAVFTQAAKTLNFAEAARDLRMSPPAVTKTISNLEHKLQKKLFWRTTRSIRMTPEGERFLEMAQNALASLEAAENFSEEKTTPEELTGQIRISCSYTIAIRRVAKLLASFHAKYPGITIDLHLSDQQVDLVEEGIDMAVRIMEPVDSSLIMRKLTDNPIGFFASRSYLKKNGEPKTLSALEDHQVLYIPVHAHSKFRKCGKPLMKVVGKTWLHSVSGDVLVAMGRRDAGVIVRSVWGVCNEVADGTLIELNLNDELVSKSAIYAVYPPNRFLPQRVRLWIDHLVEGFAKAY